MIGIGITLIVVAALIAIFEGHSMVPNPLGFVAFWVGFVMVASNLLWLGVKWVCHSERACEFLYWWFTLGF